MIPGDVMDNLFESIMKLFNGIQSEYPMNPNAATNRFQELLEEHGFEYMALDIGLGYAYKDDKPMMLVYWDDTGVIFKEYKVSNTTMTIIQIAFVVLSEQDEISRNEEDTVDLNEEESSSEWL